MMQAHTAELRAMIAEWENDRERHARYEHSAAGDGTHTGIACRLPRCEGEEVKLPPGYSISWSGQFEFLERATQKLKLVGRMEGSIAKASLSKGLSRAQRSGSVLLP